MSKRLICLTVVLLVVVAAAWGDVALEQRRTQFGVQVGSDSFVTALLYTPWVELGLKAQLAVLQREFPNENDGTRSTSDQSFGVAGIHLGYLFYPGDTPYNLSIGLEGRIKVGFADITYEPGLQFGPRIALNYRLHRNVLLSGILNPVWVLVEDERIKDSPAFTTLLVRAPYGSVAVTFLL